MSYADLPASEFGFPGPLRDRLVAAILDRTKTSTTGLVEDYEHDGTPIPQPGDRSVLIDSAGEPVAILEVTAVRLVPLADMDLAHVIDEGEGDTTVAQWRRGHESFWRSDEFRAALEQPDFTVDDSTMTIAERFAVIALVPAAETVTAAVAAESAALAAAIRCADPVGLDRTTCCPPWTVRDEFAHTSLALSRTLAALDADEPPAPPISPAAYYALDARFAPALDGARIDDAQHIARQPITVLVDDFEAIAAEVVARAVATPRSRRVITRHHDSMRLTDFLVTRVFEVAVHGLDLADGLGVAPWLTVEAAEVVENLLFGVRAADAAVALGLDRASLIRAATGRAPLTEEQRATVAAHTVTAMTLNSRAAGPDRSWS